MKRDPVLMAAAVAFAGASAFGSAVSISHDLPGRPLGVSIPLSVRKGLAVGWGAGVAAPWPMPLTALLAAASTGERDPTAGVVCVGLGIGCVAGTLVESVTYHPRSWPPAVRGAILLNLAASVLLGAAGQRARRRRSRDGDG